MTHPYTSNVPSGALVGWIGALRPWCLVEGSPAAVVFGGREPGGRGVRWKGARERDLIRNEPSSTS